VHDTDLDALRRQKAELLELLRAEVEVPVPSEPCGLCGGPLAWVEGWPSAGDCRWLCPVCSASPTSSLAAVLAGLSTGERRRLEAEAAAGDELARVLLAEAGGHAREATS
jgi:hypothetical protein